MDLQLNSTKPRFLTKDVSHSKIFSDFSAGSHSMCGCSKQGILFEDLLIFSGMLGFFTESNTCTLPPTCTLLSDIFFLM
jgi:hypothetical protein